MEESELEMLLCRMRMLEKEIKPGILQTRCKQLTEDLTCSGNFENSLNILSQYLFDRDLTVAIGKCFPNLVLQLISNIMPHHKNASPADNGETEDMANIHIEYCLILGKLVTFHPDVLQFSLQYFSTNPSPFEHYLETKPISKKRKILSLPFDSVKEIEVVECCFNFLNVAADVFRQKWNWSQFIHKFLCSFDPMVKWLTCQCISLLFGTSEFQLRKLEKVVMGRNKKALECLMKYIAQNNSKFKCLPSNEPSTTSSINFHFLSRVVNVAGVLLPVFDSANKGDGFLVPVESTQDNLRSLALAVASGKATCLIGPVGCGKTSLVEHLAALTGRNKDHLRKVQLGDQTDSRTLLGTYRCTDIPGEFVWQPGVLTQAVQKGQWLLLEDIDCAAIDVASVLSSLLERNVLSVPGYRDALPVAPGFQLFVTQRTLNTVSGYQKQTSTASALLQKHWAQIYVEPLSRQELVTVVETLFPTLKTISSRMVDVFMLFSVGSHQTSLQNTNDENHAPLVKTLHADTSDILALKSGRLTSTRDLIKWCTRAVVDFSVVSHDSALKVLQDAIDIFACSVPEQESRVPLAIGIGAFLGIVETKAEYYCNTYKPNVSLQPSSLIVGRALVPRKEVPISSVNLHERRVTFSFTRRSTCLLERIACCVNSNEPVLLVGETGTGKTSSIQYLAKETGHKLVVINMNQQSDSSDLLGGYKPVDLKYVISPIRNEFESLFRSYFDGIKNAKFLTHISTCFNNSDWKTLLALMTQSQIAAVRRLCNTNIDDLIKSGLRKVSDPSTESEKIILLKRWRSFGLKLAKIDQQLKSQMSLAFAFIEGSLVKALKEGHWVLLDEINLASAETLECLSGLLESSHSSINLLERGDDDVIERHKEFTLFACMNPATDVGKRDLPAGLRNRFTEFYVEELTDRNDLMLLVGDYLRDMSIPPSIFESIYKFYINIRKEAKLTLMDGTGQSPHYSLRTLCRALAAAPTANCGTVTRSLYETTCLSFLTQLDSTSHPKVEAMIANAVLGKKNLKSVIKQPIPEPKSKGKNFIPFEGYWICQGQLKPIIPDDYVLTPSVRKNLRDLVRIISLGKLPILLQGDTSVGKTSLITYIAKASGNRCVRINNHQHTDLQEYVGSYATDANGKLVFREGVLVEAMRKGYWIILDELNLAPSDVLEALNRVLDDNRELFIPETQQVVKADPNFMLFATQNPPGLYGGRKLLSRAFRNRFVELHFDEIPRPELETIMHQRCHMPPSYCKKVISVMSELQARRKGSAAVQGKEGFITLRDLFRWGQRYRVASDTDSAAGKYYDWDQHIADEGYLVLAGRVRQTDERKIIREVLQKHIRRTVDPENLFTLSTNTSPVTRKLLETIVTSKVEEFKHVVWTFNMRRLAVLVAKCFTFKEPVLLVGETGCGKTTVCQVIAALKSSKLFAVNCHMHTEGSDFLGGLRPVRNYNNDGKLFEWADGPLIDAMKTGQLFLADEISLADDSVLERLNSLLEPDRQLLLAEKGLDLESDSACVVSAAEGFHFIGTMNPGGDYGKKELSPALRNRFTEIWCDHVTTREDLLAVLERSVDANISLGIYEDGTSGIGHKILDFVHWFKGTKIGERFPCSIRDLLSWVHFINSTTENNSVDASEAFVHGASLIFLDCFGTGLSGAESLDSLNAVRKEAIEFVIKQVESVGSTKIDNLRRLLLHSNTQLSAEKVFGKFGIDPFYISCGAGSEASNGDEVSSNFSFTAPTTGINTMRLLRGLQLKKAILLEGSPGVGKTSLVTALAKISGHRILRINLSDQTDVSDLFGADLPTEDGSFAWREGAFLTALQNGDWILLDELNLAPQAVLEGLNACLDHRGEIFIPELGKTFKVKQGTRIFACQNPLRQGGSRRGLPQSFLNRFTQVYVDTLSSDDLLFITSSQYPKIPSPVLQNMITMNSKILTETSELLLWGHRGSPWELNLRDIQRWCDGIMKDCSINQRNFTDANVPITIKPGKMAQLLYVDRMRTADDKTHVKTIYEKIFYPEYPMSSEHPLFYMTEEKIHVGDASIKRSSGSLNKNVASDKNLLVLRNQLTTLKSLIQCVNMNWLAILVGPTASGKSSSVQVLAQLIGKELKILPVTSAMDTIDILGGFEQADYNRHLEDISTKVETILMSTLQRCLLSKEYVEATQILKKWEAYKTMGYTNTNVVHTMEEETKMFNLRQGVLKTLMVHLSDKNKGNDLSFTIADTLERLQRLNAMVLKEGSINAGGKFEWVDSLLVKCLLDGSWLLIDNVNLCSSAVLDRLNGLLEPNGVLSIPERGAAVNDIKPHPDFRMFFTMDPKNGEISRAMRNRGVEIYIVGSEETPGSAMTDTVPVLDMSAMLSSTGLPPQCKNLVILAHQRMCSFIDGYDKPSQCHLLQAAFLTSQQILRGESIKDSVINSFSDVYIKSRIATDFITTNQTIAEHKNRMLTALESIVETDAKVNDYHLEEHTFSTVSLQTVSKLEIVKQQAFLLKMALKSLSAPVTPDHLHKIAYLVFHFYHLSSKNDYELRYNYFNYLYSSPDFLDCKNVQSWLHSLNGTLYDLVFTYASNDQLNDYPWDLEFLPELSQPGDNFNRNYCNKLSVLLYYFTIKALQDYDYGNKKKALSALDYSTNVLTGKTIEVFQIPVLTNCSIVFEQLEKTLLDFVSNEKIDLSNDIWCEMVQFLRWRNRFHTACNEPLMKTVSNKKSILRDSTVLNLNIHYKWMKKHLRDALIEIGGENLSSSNFEMFQEKTDRFVQSPLRLLCKHFRRFFGQPARFPNEATSNNCQNRDVFISQATILKHEKCTLTIGEFLNIHVGKYTAYKRVLKSIKNAYNFPDDDLEDALSDVENNDTHKLFVDSDQIVPQLGQEGPGVNIQSITELTADSYAGIELWPIKEYLILRMCNLYKMKLFECFLRHFKAKEFPSLTEHDQIPKRNLPSNKILIHLSEVVDSAPALPVRLHSLLSDLTLIQENPDNEKIISMIQSSSEMWDEMSKQVAVSPTTNPNYWQKMLLNEFPSLKKIDNEDLQMEVNQSRSMSFPHLTQNAVKLVVQNQFIDSKGDNHESSIISMPLTKWRSRSKQLATFHLLLWRNMVTLNEESLNFHLLDTQALLVNFERMVLCLTCALLRNNEMAEIHARGQISRSEIIQICLNKINDTYHIDNAPKFYFTNVILLKNHIVEWLGDCIIKLMLIEKWKSKSDHDDNTKIDFKSDFNAVLWIGQAWTLFAASNLIILSQVGSFDPAKKERLKLDYIEEDLHTLDSLIDVKILQGVVQENISVENNESESLLSWNHSRDLIQSNDESVDKESLYKRSKAIHPHAESLIEAKLKTAEKAKTLSKNATYRHPDSNFSALSKDFKGFISSVGSPKLIVEHYESLSDICTQLIRMVTDHNVHYFNPKIYVHGDDVIKKYQSWLHSINYSYMDLSVKYAHLFPDLTKPFLNAITQLIYGLNMLRNLAFKLIIKLKSGDSFNPGFVDRYMEDLIRFPFIDQKCNDFTYMVNNLTSSDECTNLMISKLNNHYLGHDPSDHCRYRLLKVSLQEFESGCLTRGSISKGLWEALNEILVALVCQWQKQQQAIQKKKEDEDLLYVNRTKCDDPTEDEQTEKELAEMFPSFSDPDFADFKLNILEKKKKKDTSKTTESDDVTLITFQDIVEISTIHSNLMTTFTTAEWLRPGRSNRTSRDYLSPLLERYSMFSSLWDRVSIGIEESLDGKVLPSLLILIAYARGLNDGEDHLDENSLKHGTSVVKPNFYLSPWVSETKKCLSTVELVITTTAGHLIQWPDFPTLNDIMTVARRILDFPLTSPVSRFLTGLELLRDKIEEWNKSAHKKNNMIDVGLAVGQHIVTWRKLELANWKDSLNNTFERVQSGAHKWWFHIYTLVDCFLFEKPMNTAGINENATEGTKPSDGVITTDQFIEAMQHFMEKSSLAEYNKRLEILYTFHCHSVHFDPSSRRDKLISILWNMYNYYSQFSAQVTQAIKDKRTPIEKKLRDFVKICTWERDLSYWAVKDLVDKAHRTLHKRIKEFEGVLQSKAHTFLSIDKSTEKGTEIAGVWDRPKRVSNAPTYHYMIDPQNYAIPPRFSKKFFAESDKLDEDSEELADNLVLLPRASSLFNKAKTLCKETILNCMYPGLIQSLDGFVTEVIDTSKHLQDLEISADLPKNKQKSQAKGHLQQKKKALADLFRTLTKMGVSYRTGLVKNAARNGVIVDFVVAPIHLNAAFSYLQNKRCDNVLLSVWDGCETYYQRCISRMGGLLTALLSPSPDLGPQNIERCRGYSIHLMLLVQKQKKKIAKHSRWLCLLRNQVAQMTTLCDSEAPHLNQQVPHSRLNNLNDALCTIITTAEQFDLVLKAYPPLPTSENKEIQIAFDLAITDSPMVGCHKFDAAWHEVNAKLKQILVVANKQKIVLNKLTYDLPCVFSPSGKSYNKSFLSQSHIEVMNDALCHINEISNKIGDIVSLYDLKITDPVTGASKFINPVVNSLRHLNAYLSDHVGVLSPLGADDVELKLCFKNTVEDFSSDAESLVNFVLIKIQQIYKKYTTAAGTDNIESNIEETSDVAAADNVPKNEEEEDDAENLIRDNHLKKELHENVTSDISDLDLLQLITKLDSVIVKYVSIMNNDTGSVAMCKKQFIKCIPLLEQVSLIAQFFITQQVAAHRVSCKMLSVLLNIFIDLGSKGFCIPSDLGLEGEGEGQGTKAGGMGLADGEGEKDVSDRIENQDQLDDAHKPGEEKSKEKDKDCKEEDNGIEMTDDFESHLQDLEKKEGSDNEEEEDDDDADKQMGETETGADKLDEQIWGSDDEEEADENENQNQEKEEKGDGKPMDDKQMGAKEDSSKKEEESETGGDEKKKDKKKKDINEMEEPEYDDDQVDPYHGKQKPLPEPEPMDLPDDLNVDDQEGKEDQEEEGDEKNPFEIDVMDDKKESLEEDANQEEESDKNNKDKGQTKDDRDDITDEEDGDPDDKPEDSEKQEKMDEDVDDENKSDEDGTEVPHDPATEEMPQEEEEESSKPPPNIPGDEKLEDNPENAEDPAEENEKEALKDEAKPSQDKPTSEDNVESSAAEKGSKDLVQTNPQIDKEQEAAPYEQSQEQDGDEKDAVGQSEISENQKGHKGDRQDRPQSNARESAKNEKEQRKDKRNKPGSTDQDRALGEVKEPVQKKMKTLNMQDKEKEADDNKEDEEGARENDNDELEADLYQHIKQAKETDTQAIDAATKEQAEKQPVPNKPDDENADEVNPDDDIEMDIPEDMEVDESPVDKLEPENVGQDKKETKDKASDKGEKGDDAATGETALEVEGDNVLTMGVERGMDTSYHTKLDMVRVPFSALEPSSVSGASFRDAVRQPTASGSVNAEETAVWHSLWGRTATQARMLTEKLRLVLEPTGLSRLAGDYRTGRRINMRRVIPYIASHFRKDRIWLRRTRPARREYHIAVAIDDSSSMCDNQSKELAFESLALVSQALNLLEAGELAVLSFGEDTKVLHSFGEQFTESSGCKLLHHLTFQQTKTRIAHLVDFSSVMFEEQCSVSSAPNAKLLLIVSDGRGIFSEGEARVVQAVRRARQQGVFMVYLIVDNPASKVSIMDIRTPVFNPATSELERLDSYLDSFPFPFYLILRDIAALPAVLSDALRQWFELAANIDKQ